MTARSSSLPGNTVAYLWCARQSASRAHPAWMAAAFLLPYAASVLPAGAGLSRTVKLAVAGRLGSLPASWLTA